MRSKTSQQALAIPTHPLEPGEKRQMKVIDVHNPLWDELKPNEIIVAITQCGLCATDIDLAEHEGHGRATKLTVDGKTFNPTTKATFKKKDELVTEVVEVTLNGHEMSGMAVRKGSAVKGIDLGDIGSIKVRTGGHSINCIACRTGNEHLCLQWQEQPGKPSDMTETGIFEAPGGFTYFLKITDYQFIKAPEGLDREHVWMGEPTAIAVNSIVTAVEHCWHRPGFLEETEQGQPAIMLIGAGGLSTIAVPAFSEFPENIFEAMRQGVIPGSYLDRSWMSGYSKNKDQLVKPKVFYVGRSSANCDALKVRAAQELGIEYISLDDEQLPFEEQPLLGEFNEDGSPKTQRIYNLSPLLKYAPKGYFDLVIEMTGCGPQNARMALRPSTETELQGFLKKAEHNPEPRLENFQRNSDGTCVGPNGGPGGLLEAGTVLVITSITGGNTSYPNWPCDSFCWSSSLNSSVVLGVVNYSVQHCQIGLISQLLADRRVPGWANQIKERTCTLHELQGYGMFELKSSVSGRVVAQLNDPDEVADLINEIREAGLGD